MTEQQLLEARIAHLESALRRQRWALVLIPIVVVACAFAAQGTQEIEIHDVVQTREIRILDNKDNVVGRWWSHAPPNERAYQTGILVGLGPGHSYTEISSDALLGYSRVWLGRAEADENGFAYAYMMASDGAVARLGVMGPDESLTLVKGDPEDPSTHMELSHNSSGRTIHRFPSK